MYSTLAHNLYNFTVIGTIYCNFGIETVKAQHIQKYKNTQACIIYVASFEAKQEHICNGQKMDPYKRHKQ